MCRDERLRGLRSAWICSLPQIQNKENQHRQDECGYNLWFVMNEMSGGRSNHDTDQKLHAELGQPRYEQ